MYGWRAQIGLIIPSNNTVIEPEFARMVPEGVSVHSTRILSGGLTPEAITRMVDDSMHAVEELTSGDVSVIAYACLATSLIKGPDWSRGFQESVENRTGKPVLTAASATVEALQSRQVSRIALATPYPEHINERVSPFFERAGIEVVSLRNVTVQNSLEVCRLPPSVAYRLAREADHVKAQAICILATDFRTIDTLNTLERDLGKLVVSTNQALLWRALGLAHVRDDISGYGSLLSALREPK